MFRRINSTLEIKDIIALLIIVGGFVLIANGANGFASTTVSLVAGYYFGRREEEIMNYDK